MSGSIGTTASSTASSAVSSAVSSTAATTGSSRAGPKLSADLGTFLTLLTTQLRNQDPTKPMDTEQLTQQLTQFATVEQQIAGNQALERLLELQQAGQLAGSGQLVGRRVVLETDRLPLQDGRAEVVLPAAGAARGAVIEVRDAAGTVIRRQEARLGSAATAWQWDGRDSTGRQRPDGAYSVRITGVREDGGTAALTPMVAGRVTGALRSDGNLVLRLGATTVGYDRLRELPGG